MSTIKACRVDLKSSGLKLLRIFLTAMDGQHQYGSDSVGSRIEHPD
jgi:hypothetical protein